MELSARNQISATVQSVKLGDLMAEIVVTLSGGEELVSVITADSARRLKLEPGSSVKVVVKSTEVMLATKG